MVEVGADVEKWLLGMWLNGEQLDDMDMFQPYHFPNYGNVLHYLKTHRPAEGKHIDYVDLVNETMIDHAELSYLMKVDAKNLYESAILNMQKVLADEWLMSNPKASPDEIAENMKRFSKKTADLPSVSREPVQDLIDELDRRQNEKPVNTGLTELDNMLCGIRKKELTSVGARPSVGKSAFMLQVAMQVARSGKKILFFPLEMSELAITQRMLLRYTDIPQSELRNGLSRNTWDKASYGIDTVTEFLNRGNFLTFERCNDLQTIRRLIDLHKPYAIFIDQLEQLKDGSEKFQDKRTRFSHMTHELQGLAMDADVAVWLACQINRAADDTPPTMANLKESGSIEEDSDNVILLHREGEKTELQNIQLELAKQREGQCGKIQMMFDAPHFTFRGIETRY